ncbi:hypothetical protein GCM10010517_31760 [Streptosporangium fragile]|uniref:DUF3040 domain-containing protein n=1 Tax=Streptosporangium fragile TaxID=46186 RepID=A0ABP6IES0_9ACTN
MARSSASGDELRAAMEARKDLGPEYEDSLIANFLDKMDQEIDKRVDDRLATRARASNPPVRPSVDAGQRLALAIISLSLGVPGSVALSFSEMGDSVGFIFVLVLLWLGIIGVNLSFTLGRRRSD